MAEKVFATLEEVKTYLNIDDEANSGKVKMILDSINKKVHALVGDIETDSNLRLAVCIWVDVIFNSLGDRYISPSGVAYNIGGTGVPLSVSQILDSYINPVEDTDHESVMVL